MARMIPQSPMPGEFNGSFGEEKVYESLQALPDDYIVFHSVHWHKKKISGAVIWGESDFTVFNPKRGIIVIEVKSGGIRHDENGWHQTNTITHEEKRMKDPLAQAERSKFTFVDLLSEQDEKFHTYWIESAVWFPSIQNIDVIGAMPPSYASEIVLTEKDLSSPKFSIERIFNYYGMNVKPFFNAEDEKNVINVLSPSFHAVVSMSSQIGEQEFLFNRMTEEQGYLLDYLEEQNIAAIQGGAGTGKTMLALEKAKHASKSGKVLFLCFNKFLLESLKANNGSNENIEFYNLPGLVCSKTGAADAGGNEGISHYLNSIDPMQWGFKHIIIDEGQDFYEKHLEILSDIAELTQGCFYVFYDKNQMVQSKDVPNNNSITCLFRKFNNRYLFHAVSTIEFAPKKSSVPNMSSNDIKMAEVFIPVPDKQKKIADVLDRFEMLCNDIENGIPAEIAARQKQYEYYRDKLLTFKEA